MMKYNKGYPTNKLTRKRNTRSMVFCVSKILENNLGIDIQNCTYGKSKHERKDFHNQNHKIYPQLDFKRHLTSGMSLTSAGNESRIQVNDLSLSLDVLVTRD